MNLQTLNLSHNQLSTLDHPHYFSGLGKLLELDLSHNKILNLTNNVFSELKAIKILNSSFNHLIETSFYELLLPSLVHLDISYNLLVSLNPASYNVTRTGINAYYTLDTLDLSYNFIREIKLSDDNSKKNFKNTPFEKCSFLNLKNKVDLKIERF